tara:strand:+ start:945 stop:1430 length:486 start_codon:yes stop_codon:yes gene_type:complete
MKTIDALDVFIRLKQLPESCVEFTAHEWSFFEDSQIVDEMSINEQGQCCFSWVEYVLFKVYYDQLNDGFYLISHTHPNTKIDISAVIEERVADHFRDDPDDCEGDEILVKVYNCDGEIKVTVDNFHGTNGVSEPDITHCLNQDTYNVLKSMTYQDVIRLTK